MHFWTAVIHSHIFLGLFAGSTGLSLRSHDGARIGLLAIPSGRAEQQVLLVLVHFGEIVDVVEGAEAVGILLAAEALVVVLLVDGVEQHGASCECEQVREEGVRDAVVLAHEPTTGAAESVIE